MRVLMPAIVLFALSVSPPAHALLIDSSNIQVSGTLYRAIYPLENTIDNDRDTFWHGTNDIQIGETNYLAYRFDQTYALSRIDIFDDYTNDYSLGELLVQVSNDSSNGLDGSWNTVAAVAGDFLQDDFSLNIATEPVQWTRLWMEYQGRGAHGGTPAFYLSEINFHGEVVSVPEPTTLALLGFGLAGLGFARRVLSGFVASRYATRALAAN